jgi:hypothetical protein
MDLDKQYKAIFQAIANASPEDRKSIAADLIAVYPGDDKWFIVRSAKDFIRKLEDQDYEATLTGERSGGANSHADKFTWTAKDIDSLIIDNSEAVGEPFDLFPDKDNSAGED